jgi:hypothetical protein
MWFPVNTNGIISNGDGFNILALLNNAIQLIRFPLFD